jgi:hypothetical protein
MRILSTASCGTDEAEKRKAAREAAEGKRARISFAAWRAEYLKDVGRYRGAMGIAVRCRAAMGIVRRLGALSPASRTRLGGRQAQVGALRPRLPSVVTAFQAAFRTSTDSIRCASRYSTRSNGAFRGERKPSRARGPHGGSWPLHRRVHPEPCRPRASGSRARAKAKRSLSHVDDAPAVAAKVVVVARKVRADRGEGLADAAGGHGAGRIAP